jgi:hypothetical protein
MNNPNTIDYEKGWKDAYTPTAYTHADSTQSEQSEDNHPTPKKRKSNIPLLTIIQLTVCAIAVALGFGIKTFGGEIYSNIHNWYYEQLNDEIILNENFDSFSLDDLISSIQSNSDNESKN